MLDIAEVKALYSKCFPEDSSAMVDLFFAQKLGLHNCHYLIENNILACQLFVVDKIFYYLKNTFTLPFIVGLGTETNSRGKGLATKLMKKVLQNLSSPFVALYPFDHNFYKKMGFATVSHDYKSETVADKIGSDEVRAIYDKYTLDKDFFIVRNKEDFSFQQSIMNIDKVNYRSIVPTGYTNGEETVILGKEGVLEGTMVRIVNLKKALYFSKITLPPMKIVDNLVDRNNVIVKVVNGKMISCDSYKWEIDIETLCLILFGKAKNMPFAFPSYDGHILDKY